MMLKNNLKIFVNRLKVAGKTTVALALVLPAMTTVALATALDTDPPPVAAALLPSDFTSCNVRQESQLERRLLEAQLRLIELASDLDESFLESASNGAPRFERWFGYFDSERFARVRTIYRNILSATENQTIGFDCACTAFPDGGVSAYVYSTNPYNINLCPGFWSLSHAWQSSVLVHELSHFAVLGNARDFSYGHFATAQLALDKPDEAVRNAESYTLFFLNDPPIPLAGAAETQDAPVVLQLAAGASHDGKIGKLQTSLYGIEGVSSVILQPANGADVDLHVYQGRQRVCVSNKSGGQTERCELDPALAYSAEVIPFTNDLAENYIYTILASEDTLNAQPVNDDEADEPSTGGSGGGALAMLLAPLVMSALVTQRRRRIRLTAGRSPAQRT